MCLLLFLLLVVYFHSLLIIICDSVSSDDETSSESLRIQTILFFSFGIRAGHFMILSEIHKILFFFFVFEAWTGNLNEEDQQDQE